MKHEKIYLLTDGCMWEQNKRNKTFYPHSIEVVDMETGQVVYVKSGSRITLIEGETTSIRTQEEYNKTTSKMPDNGQDKLQGTESKTGSNQIKNQGL